MENNIKNRQRLYFRIFDNFEDIPVHEIGFILSKEKNEDMISLFTHHTFPADNPRNKIGIIIPGRFEIRNEKDEYETLDLSPLTFR